MLSNVCCFKKCIRNLNKIRSYIVYLFRICLFFLASNCVKRIKKQRDWVQNRIVTHAPLLYGELHRYPSLCKIWFISLLIFLYSSSDTTSSRGKNSYGNWISIDYCGSEIDGWSIPVLIRGSFHQIHNKARRSPFVPWVYPSRLRFPDLISFKNRSSCYVAAKNTRIDPSSYTTRWGYI